MEQESHLGHHLDGMIEKWEQEMCKHEEMLKEKSIEEKHERTKQAHEELKSLMFGGQS